MRKVAIVTDSNSGITPEEADKLGVRVVPMPIIVDGEEFFEDVSITKPQFYERLVKNANVSTSQPAIGQIVELWEELLKTHDSIVHIPMSSALSMSCETARNFAKEFNGRVVIVDNRRISVTLRRSVEDAIALAEQGKTAQEIADKLHQTAQDSSIYLMVDTLKYLKKGGRITPAAAVIGTLLNIKPVLQIQGGKLDSFAKVMNIKQAKARMITAIKNDIENRFGEFKDNLEIAVVASLYGDRLDEFKVEVENQLGVKVALTNQVPLSIACHLGPNVIAVTCSRVVNQ